MRSILLAALTLAPVHAFALPAANPHLHHRQIAWPNQCFHCVTCPCVTVVPVIVRGA
jgi:Fe-S-cluster-containing dehydrogenase component